MECPSCGGYVKSYSRRCTVCGKAIPPAQHLLEESGIVPPAAPAPVARTCKASLSAGARAECRPGGLGDRLIAAVLDHVVILSGCAVVTVWSFRRWGVAGLGESHSEFRVTWAALLMTSLVGAAYAFAYLWVFEAAFQCSLGKTIVGLRVVCTTKRGRMAASAIRNALRVVDGMGCYLLGALVAASSNLRQRVGDMMAGTVVVEEEFSAGVKALAMVAWFAMLVLTGWAMVRVWAGPLRTDAPRYFSGSAVELGYGAGAGHIRAAGWRVDFQLAADAGSGAKVSAAEAR